MDEDELGRDEGKTFALFTFLFALQRNPTWISGRNYKIVKVLYSYRSPSHAYLRLGSDSLVLLMNVLKRKREGFLGGENLMIGERENGIP